MDKIEILTKVIDKTQEILNILRKERDDLIKPSDYYFTNINVCAALDVNLSLLIQLRDND